MLKAALALGAHVPVFPLGRWSKIPLIPKSQGGNGCLDATRDPRQITEWWSEHPDANIAIATGHSFCVLDIDNWNAEQYAAAKGLPTTVTSSTPHGSHRLYRKPPDMIVGNVAGLLGVTGIDRRGDRGYIVAPPSVVACEKENCPQHKPGAPLRYGWAVHGEMTDAPDWLLTAKPRAKGGLFGPHWCRVIEAGIPEGTRHETLKSLFGRVLGPEPPKEVLALLCLSYGESQGLPREEVMSMLRWFGEREGEKHVRRS